MAFFQYFLPITRLMKSIMFSQVFPFLWIEHGETHTACSVMTVFDSYMDKLVSVQLLFHINLSTFQLVTQYMYCLSVRLILMPYVILVNAHDKLTIHAVISEST